MGKQLTGVTAWLDRTFYPDHVSEGDIYRSKIQERITASSVVLEAGCGRGKSPINVKNGVGFVVGCDLNPDISHNTNVDVACLADLNSLPFLDSSFDLIISRYVFEHLKTPDACFLECSRVLRPNGHLIILTPNAWHYVSVISRFTPMAFHNFVAKMRGNLPEDTFDTFYLANTKNKLEKLAGPSNLRPVEFYAYETKPNYLAVSPLTYAAGILYERLVNRFRILSCLRVSIIAVFEKERR